MIDNHRCLHLYSLSLGGFIDLSPQFIITMTRIIKSHCGCCCMVVSRTLLTYLFHGAESFLKTQPFSASQEIPHILLNPKVHYHIHKCLLPIPILSQLSPVHTPTSHFPKINLNIILLSVPGCPQWSLSLRFPHQNPVHASPLPICATCPAYLILLDFITCTILGEQYSSLSSSLCSFLHSPVTSSLLGPNILLNTLFSNTLSLRSSLNVSDQVSRPYKQRAKL